jgi:putative hydrolase of the HAD superfamily
LPGAQAFLQKLRASGKRVVLVTNSHPTTLAIKNERVALTQYFDACYSSQPFDAPKEDAAFWPRLAAREEFSRQRTLFIDDSLRVLQCARDYGIAHLRAVRCPDSGAPPQATADFAAIDRVAELL